VPRVVDARALPVLGTIVFHALVIAGLSAAEGMVHAPHAPTPLEVTIEVQKPPPPPPPEPSPAPAPATAPTAAPAPKKRIVTAIKQPPPPPPAPGPPDSEPPAPQKVYVLPGGGNVAVTPGPAEGTPTGRPGGTGRGTGGGGPPESTGSGPRPVPLASVATMPEALGDYDYSKDYPAEALRQGIEGEVVVRVLVAEDGAVAEARLVRGLGGGLSQKALELARRLRFKPARDDGGRAVATWITWTFHFTPPH
jgi:periplasmic protein TonB